MLMFLTFPKGDLHVTCPLLGTSFSATRPIMCVSIWDWRHFCRMVSSCSTEILEGGGTLVCSQFEERWAIKCLNVQSEGDGRV